MSSTSRGSSAVSSNRALSNIDHSQFGSGSRSSSLSGTHTNASFSGSRFGNTSLSTNHFGGSTNRSFSSNHSFSNTSFHNGFNNGFHGNGFHNGFNRGFGCWNCGFRFGFGFGFGWGFGFYNPFWWGPYWGFGYPYYPYYGLYGYPYYGYPGYSIGYSDPNYSSSNQNIDQNSNGDYSFSANNNLGVAAPGTTDNSSINNDNGALDLPLENSENTNPVTGNVAASTPTALIYLKDGTTYAASDYWLQGGQLHYTVNYGGESTLNMDEVDLQRTVDENARRGIRFSLKPNPSSVNSAPRQQNQNDAAPVTSPAPAPAPQMQTSSQSQT